MKLLTAAVRGAAGTAAAAYGIYAAAPAVTSIRSLRVCGLPALAGVGRPDHVALTFDDGPDRCFHAAFPRSAGPPWCQRHVLLLGFMTERNPGLAAELVAADMRSPSTVTSTSTSSSCRTPTGTCDDIRRAHDLIGEVSGQAPKYYRPPYGVLTATAAHTATSWVCRSCCGPLGAGTGTEATPASVHQTVRRHLDGGATILLHDSDSRTSAPLSWKSALFVRCRGCSMNVRHSDLPSATYSAHNRRSL